MRQFTSKQRRGVSEDAMRFAQSSFDDCRCELWHNAGINAAMNIGLDAGIYSFKI